MFRSSKSTKSSSSINKGTLIKDTKTFSKCNFWAIPFRDHWHIYAGRTLRNNVTALTADENRWAKELFEGIYEIFPSDEFSTKEVALAKKEGENFIVYRIGRVELPKRSN